MGAFRSAVITKKGQELLAKVVAGTTKLEFTKRMGYFSEDRNTAWKGRNHRLSCSRVLRILEFDRTANDFFGRQDKMAAFIISPYNQRGKCRFCICGFNNHFDSCSTCLFCRS